MDSTNDIIDAGKSLIDIFSLEERITREKQQFGLTDEEVLELRDAYLLEAQTDPGEKAGQRLSDIFRRRFGMNARRSSQDILDAARSRNGK